MVFKSNVKSPLLKKKKKKVLDSRQCIFSDIVKCFGVGVQILSTNNLAREQQQKKEMGGQWRELISWDGY